MSEWILVAGSFAFCATLFVSEFFHLHHNWQPWGEASKRTTLTKHNQVNGWTGVGVDIGISTDVVFVQRRSCSSCGLTQERVVDGAK